MLTRALARSVLIAIVLLPCAALGDANGSNGSSGGGSHGPGSGPGSGGPFAPGGGSGGTVGSLPMITDGFDTSLGGGAVTFAQNTSSGVIVVVTPPNSGLIAGYVWVADGIETSGGLLDPSFPSVSFYASDVTGAYASGVHTLKLLFVGHDGHILSGCEMPHSF